MGNFFSLIQSVNKTENENHDTNKVNETTEVYETNETDEIQASVPIPIPTPTTSPIDQEENVLELVTSKGKIFNKTNKNKRALLIGVNYDNDQFKDDDLRGCVNDVINLKLFLINRLGFLPDQIEVLENEQATKFNIQDKIIELTLYAVANEKSEIWFSYSGHGTAQYSFTEQDNQSEVICPVDYNTKGIISDTWMKNNFVKCLPTDANLFVLMDCCNSGSNLNLPFCLGPENSTILNDSSYSQEELNYLCNIIKISGCKDHQTSADYYDSDDKSFQGALTNSFLTISKHTLLLKFEFLYNNILLNLKSRKFTQQPMLSYTNADLLKYELF